MRDLIFVSLENWDEVWRRNQFLCSELARRFPAIKILFVAPSYNLVHERRFRPAWTVPGFPNVSVIRPPKVAPDSVTAGRRINEALSLAHVARAARRLKITSPLLWLNSHGAGHMAGRLGERAVVYDITDDWTLAPSFPARERSLIAAQDSYLCRRADLVVVCSSALNRTRRSQCRDLLLLPNGVDVEHYAAVSRTRETARWPRPVFGYTGTLHRDRIDAGLIGKIARTFAGGSVVLAGPDHLDAETRAVLKAEVNVHFLGALSYAGIPRCMAEFDVCMVPHVQSPFTESLNPIKLWEYLAAGKPIVSTDIAGFRDYPELCRIGGNHEEFLRACHAALMEDGERCGARIAKAVGNSWRARVDALLEAFEDRGFLA